MTAAELRIGNSVFFNKNHNEIGNITSIETFLTDQFKVGFYNRIDIKYYCDEIKPIPITEEWLLKFGFEKHHSDYYNKIIMIKEDGEIKIFPSFDVNLSSAISISLFIKYVHQLQNLYFALTGHELTIKEVVI